MKAPFLIIGAVLAGLAGCGESQFASGTSTRPNVADGEGADASSRQWRKVEETFTLENRSVDIFFALDTSSSMLDEQQAVEANMSKFLTDILNVGIDVRVTAIGSEDFHFPTDLPADRFAVVNKSIGSRDVLKILTDFFTVGAYPLALHDNSQVEVVIISDDDAYPTPGYRAEDFRGPAGRTTVVNGIVGLVDGQNRTDCIIEHRGENHITLAQQTGGKILDLCNPNWDDLVKQLSDAIIGRNRDFDLQDSPNKEMEIVVTVDDQVIDASRYKVHETTNSITFAEDVPIGPNSLVKIVYFVPESDQQPTSP